MNIALLRIKNFLSIRDVEIKPGQINQITGGNNQGKTSIIKAIEFAVNGATDGSLVRNGQDAAEVIMELDDKTMIRRRINSEGKQSVEVKNAQGFKAPSPQTFLESLFGSASFNPLELLDPKKRHDAILNSIAISLDAATLAKELGVEVDALPPLDYTQHGLKVLETCHKYYYQRRAEANKDAADKKKRWETYKADLPEESLLTSVNADEINRDLALIQQRIDGFNERIRGIEEEERECNRAHQRHEEAQTKVSDLDAKVQFHRHEMEKAQAAQEEAEKTRVAAAKEIPAAIQDKRPIMETVAQLKVDYEKKKAGLKDVEKERAVLKQIEMVNELSVGVANAEQFSQGLTEKVERLAGPLKKKIMSAADMPVQGLEYKSGQFLVDGIPVDNLSASKALKLAVGVARKLAKKSKLICIDGAEALDDSTYKELMAEIKEDGYEYFITRVGPTVGIDYASSLEMKNGAVVQ